MRKLLMILALAISMPAMASSTALNTDGLTAEQMSQLAAKANEMRKQPTNVSAEIRKEAEAWGELGANMGRAMVGAAREVGVAANEFSQTSLGKVVVVLVAYTLVGQEALGIVFGTLTLVVGTLLAIWVAMTQRWYSRQYEVRPVLWGMFNRRIVTAVQVDDDARTTKVIAAAAILVLSWLVGLNTIF